MLAAGLWKGMLSMIKSVDAPDPKTAVIKLTRSVPDFLDLPGGTTIQYSIVSKAACQNKTCDFSKPGTPTSGPWYLKEYIVKSRMVLEKNPYYGFPGYPKFDRIEDTFTADPLARIAAIQSGAADFTSPVAATDAEKLKKDTNVSLFISARFDQGRGFGFDLMRPPFSDKRVRQAVGYLIEPQQIVDACWYGFAAPLWGGVIYEDREGEWGKLLARNIWKKPRPDRLQLVNQLLDQAGWRDINKDGVRESQVVQGIADGTLSQRPWRMSRAGSRQNATLF
jgi:peptide/nickel transport system substrate-binding protein